MAKIIGIDLGTTYCAVSVWDDKKKEAVILENLRGNRTTPSVVSFNKAGELIVGEDAKQNLWAAPEDTASQIKREMGTDFHVSMRGKEYNPQTISAFILRYLKQCAEAKLGEPVYDAVITVPAYFTEVQRSATRDAGIMAGLNVHQLINEPTAAAIAFGLEKRTAGERKIYAVYDLGGGTFDVSIIEIGDEIVVLGTGGDPRLGGLDMDEAVMKWSLRQIRQQYGPDLSADESVRRRLKVEAEQIKKTLVVSETASLNVPFLTIVDGKPLNIDLSISRAQFEMLIMPLLQRSIDCWEQAVIAAREANQVDWEDLDGVLVVGGPTRLHKIREMLRDTFKKHNPDKEPEIRTDINPDEVVAMGAAIVAGTLVPFGVPPGTDDVKKEQAQETHKTEAEAAGTVAPDVVFYDVTGHSLGIAVEGVKFHRLINKDTPIPVKTAQSGFRNAADYATQLLVEVYQGENEYVAANTKIGEVKIEGIEPLSAGRHNIQVEFILDLSGTLTTICTDLRTKKQYIGSFVFKDFTRVSQEEIQKKQKELEALMPDKVRGTGTPSTGETPPTPWSGPAVAPSAVPQLLTDNIPTEWRVYWVESLDQVTKLGPTQRAVLLRAMNTFARAVMGGSPAQIEDSAYLLQDTLVEIHIVDEPLKIPPRPVRHPEVPGALDRVHFSVTAPPAVQPGASFVVDIWAHLEQQRQEVIQRAKAAVGGRDIQIKTKGPLPISRGTVLAVHLKIDGLLIEDPQDTILWEGEIGSASFAVQVPRETPEGTHLGRAAIYADGVQIARIHFELEVAAAIVEARPLPLQEKRIRTAFASYASPDRDLVLRCVQGMEKAAPFLDIFMDVHSLRSGQKWEQELWQRIPACDTFFLFWSSNASQSPWVEKEWRCALDTHGIDFIDPVPLEPPDVAPPPPELAGLHFNDWELAYQRGQRRG